MLLTALVVLSSSGCKEKNTEPNALPKAAKLPTEPKAVEETQGRIESIVFVGQKEACECTKNRIDVSWKVLQDTLKDGPQIPIKRIQLDVDGEEAKKLNEQKPLVVAPGIYFLDAKKSVVALLQGEVRVDQIIPLLQ
jgi:hypothetical protein